MLLLDPVRGLVVNVTDPRTINYLRYNKGYWTLDDVTHTTQQSGEHFPDPDPEVSDGDLAGADFEWAQPHDPEWDTHLRPGPVSG